MKIMNYLYSASMKGEESRQVLYLVGPVGAGKSSIVEALKKIVEKNGEVYALKGCPMQEEPLHLIPEHLREDFNEFLGVEIEGELCPVCSNRLEVEYENRYEDFKIMIHKNEFTEEELEVLRQKAISNATERFGWTIEQCEAKLGRNTREFLNKVNLIDNSNYK